MSLYSEMAEMICLNDGFFSFAKMFLLFSALVVMSTTEATGAITGVKLASSSTAGTDEFLAAIRCSFSRRAHFG